MVLRVDLRESRWRGSGLYMCPKVICFAELASSFSQESKKRLR
jgi:hypothetical protein